jgi:hypothetical protein
MPYIFGLIFTGWGFYALWRSIWLRRNGRFTVGTVTSVIWSHRVSNVYVSFKTERKKTVVFKAGGWTSILSSPFYQVGNQVPVLYDPYNPTNAVIYTVDFLWVLPFVLTGIGLFLFYIGFTH